MVAQTLVPATLALPHALRDAPQQRVTAGYGCRLEPETIDGLTTHQFNIGMAYSAQGCLDAHSHVSNAVELADWICRSDCGGMTWIEFQTENTCSNTIIGAIDDAFPGMKWLQTTECDAKGAPVHDKVGNTEGGSPNDQAEGGSDPIHGVKKVVHVLYESLKLEVIEDQDLEDSAQTILARDDAVQSLKDVQTECTAIRGSNNPMVAVSPWEAFTTYNILVHANVESTCAQVRQRLKAKNFKLLDDNPQYLGFYWQCFLTKDSQKTRLFFQAETDFDIDLNRSLEEAFGMESKFACHYASDEESDRLKNEAMDAVREHWHSLHPDIPIERDLRPASTHSARSLKDVTTECTVIPPTQAQNDNVDGGDAGTIYSVLVDANVEWACDHVKEQLEAKNFDIWDGLDTHGRCWQCYSFEDSSKTRVYIHASTGLTLDVNLSLDEAFGMDLKFNCNFIPESEHYDEIGNVMVDVDKQQRSISSEAHWWRARSDTENDLARNMNENQQSDNPLQGRGPELQVPCMITNDRSKGPGRPWTLFTITIPRRHTQHYCKSALKRLRNQGWHVHGSCKPGDRKGTTKIELHKSDVYSFDEDEEALEESFKPYAFCCSDAKYVFPKDHYEGDQGMSTGSGSHCKAKGRRDSPGDSNLDPEYNIIQKDLDEHLKNQKRSVLVEESGATLPRNENPVVPVLNLPEDSDPDPGMSLDGHQEDDRPHAKAPKHKGPSCSCETEGGRTVCETRIAAASVPQLDCAKVKRTLKKSGWIVPRCTKTSGVGLFVKGTKFITSPRPEDMSADLGPLLPKHHFKCEHKTSSKLSNSKTPVEHMPPTKIGTPMRGHERAPAEQLKARSANNTSLARSPTSSHVNGTTKLESRGLGLSKPNRYPTACRLKNHGPETKVEIDITYPFQAGHCGKARKSLKSAGPSSLKSFRCGKDSKEGSCTEIAFTAANNELQACILQLEKTFENVIFDCPVKSFANSKNAEHVIPTPKVGIPFGSHARAPASHLNVRSLDNSTAIRSAEARFLSHTTGHPARSGDLRSPMPPFPNMAARSSLNVTGHSLLKPTCSFITYKESDDTVYRRYHMTVPINTSDPDRFCDNTGKSMKGLSGVTVSDWDCEPDHKKPPRAKIKFRAEGHLKTYDMNQFELAFRDYDFTCSTSDAGGDDRTGDDDDDL